MARQTTIKPKVNIEQFVYGWGDNNKKDIIISNPKDVDVGLAKMIIHHHIIQPGGPMVEYYAKIGSQGSDRGMLFNPKGMFSNYEHRMESAYTSKYYIYRRITLKCFELYKQFLQTGNPVCLRNAQREI